MADMTNLSALQQQHPSILRDVVDYLSQLQTPHRPITHRVDNVAYAVKADGTLGAPVVEPDLRPEMRPLRVSTLSGFCAAVKARVNGIETGNFVVRVIDETTVTADAMEWDEFGKRLEYIQARHVELNAFPFDKYLEPEDFLLAFRRAFELTEHALNVIKVASSVTSESVVTASDDGLSQQVEMRSGAITKAKVELPVEGVRLICVRTFRDANPCEARYLLRMKQSKGMMPMVGLFEIDQMWQQHLRASIAKYLEENLPADVAIIV